MVACLRLCWQKMWSRVELGFHGRYCRLPDDNIGTGFCASGNADKPALQALYPRDKRDPDYYASLCYWLGDHPFVRVVGHRHDNGQ